MTDYVYGLVSHSSGTEIEAITETCFRTGNMLNRLLIEDEDEDPEQFTYDMNGAVTYDGYTHCTITYNVLGKPCTIEFEDGSTRENYYLSDGTGTKISYLLDDSLESTLHYRGSMVYKSEWDEIEDIVSERLESVAHPEGRFFASSYTSSGQPVLKNWHYVTDQVGSVVAVVDMDMMAEEDEDAAVERSEYYSYGKRVGHPAFPKVSGNRHRFNGKEEITDDASPYIDYGARTYSPTLRQWLSPDPLADKYFDLSPYAFCADDPVNVVDPDGSKIVGVSKKDASNVVSDLHAIFKDDVFKNFRPLIRQSGKNGHGKSLSKISETELKQAFDNINLNSDQSALVEMVVNTINSTDKHYIEYSDNLLSEQGEYAFNKELSKLGLPLDLILEDKNGIPVSILGSIFGEGATTLTSNGTHSVIITSLVNPLGREITTGHELFGHGRSFSLGREATQHQDAVQTENLIRRVVGINDINDGSNHSNGGILLNPTSLPSFR